MNKGNAPISSKIWLPLFLLAALISLLIGVHAEDFDNMRGFSATMKAFGALLVLLVCVQLVRKWR